MKGNPHTAGGPLTSKPTWPNTPGCSATSAFFILPRGPRDGPSRRGEPRGAGGETRPPGTNGQARRQASRREWRPETETRIIASRGGKERVGPCRFCRDRSVRGGRRAVVVPGAATHAGDGHHAARHGRLTARRVAFLDLVAGGRRSTLFRCPPDVA